MSVFGSSLDYVVAVVTGPAATTLAVVGVAVVGFLMLGGKLEMRRFFLSLLGAALLLNAPAIARSVVGTVPQSEPMYSAEGYSAQSEPPEREFLPATGTVDSPAPVRGSPFDPYAGTAPAN